MNQRRWKFITGVVLVLCIVAPRLLSLDTFTTVDESSWLMRSANFYYALGQRHFEKTVYAYHPAVTTMWIGVAAMMLDFPEYRGFGQGYFEKEWQFSDFLMDHNYHPREMLKTSRLITVGINSILLIAIFFLLNRLFGWFPAFTAVLFLAFDPFLLGHTRILAHEGLLSLLVLFSVLAFLGFLQAEGKPGFLLFTSAIAASLAVLTKSSASIILPFVFLLILFEVIHRIRADSGKLAEKLWGQIKYLGTAALIWLAVFVLAFIIFWPGMWVNPGKMLSEVYGNAFSYAFKGYNLVAAQVIETPEIEDAPSTIPGESSFLIYARDILWHSTPAIWAGLILSWAIIASKNNQLPIHAKQLLLTLFILALLFYLMMSLAKGRHVARYLMVTFASLSLIAGLGVGFFLSGLRNWISRKPWRVALSLSMLSLLLVQVISAFNFYPYYFNYSNPMVEAIRPGIQTPVIGYGEGLELAAAYLSEKTNSSNLTVMSWYGIGPFSYYFPGETQNLFPSTEWTSDLIERLEVSDYLVIYEYHQRRRNMPAKLLNDIANLEPEHSFWLNGIEYERIYRVSQLPDSVFIPDVADD